MPTNEDAGSTRRPDGLLVSETITRDISNWGQCKLYIADGRLIDRHVQALCLWIGTLCRVSMTFMPQRNGWEIKSLLTLYWPNCAFLSFPVIYLDHQRISKGCQLWGWRLQMEILVGFNSCLCFIGRWASINGTLSNSRNDQKTPVCFEMHIIRYTNQSTYSLPSGNLT